MDTNTSSADQDAPSRLGAAWRARRSNPLWAAAISLASLFLISVPAAAQLISAVQTTGVSRVQPLHDLDAKSYWINREDCIADDKLTFDMRVTGWNSYNFEVWAGDKDCKQSSQRTGDLAECWLVYKDRGEADFFTVTLKARDIVARQKPRDLDTSDSDRGIGTRSDCDEEWSAQLTLYFMYVDDSGNVSGTPATWTKTGVDTSGPSAPTGVTAGVADESLALHWKASSSSDLAGYQFFCMEDSSASTAAANADTGTTDTSGSALTVDASLEDSSVVDSSTQSDNSLDGATPDTGTPSASASSTVDLTTQCGQGLLVEGELPSTSSRVFACGSLTSKTGTKGYAKGLTNDTAYAVGVAGVDDLGNPGPLANIVCNSPQYVKQFYSDYRNAGGGGGGGFCSLVAGNLDGGAKQSYGLLAAAGLVWAVRRRKRL